MAYYNLFIFLCEVDVPRSLELARESSGLGSKYGHYTLGLLYDLGRGGLAKDCIQTLAFYRLAAAQGLDAAEYRLGNMYYIAKGVAQDSAEALRLFLLAAAQGHPAALFMVARCYEHGEGVAAEVTEAIRWYRLAQAAGHFLAEANLWRLNA
jgi:TPR repeat protein